MGLRAQIQIQDCQLNSCRVLAQEVPDYCEPVNVCNNFSTVYTVAPILLCKLAALQQLQVLTHHQWYQPSTPTCLCQVAESAGVHGHLSTATELAGPTATELPTASELAISGKLCGNGACQLCGGGMLCDNGG